MARDHRRLAAIVSADVVGYSLLMGRDDSATLAGLKAHRRELIDRKIAEYGGRIVKTTGDGLLLEFPSVVDAVRCAVDVQRGMAERNASVPPEQRIEFRIGINVGDIIIDGEDIFGDGVNVAARLQTLAEPGGICVSRVVRDQVLDKLSFAFEDLGAQEVKNIARPVEVYRVDLASGALQAPSRDRRRWQRLIRGRWRWLSAGVVALGIVGIAAWTGAELWKDTPRAAPPAMSVGVTPLVAPPGDAALAQRVGAWTRDLTSMLALPDPALEVVSVPASLRMGPEGTNSIGAIARTIDVRYLLEGDVRRDEDRTLIVLRLTDAATGKLVSSETVSFKDSDASRNQMLALRAAVRRLYRSLDQAEIRRVMAKPPGDGTAMDYVLWARATVGEGGTLQKAREGERLYEEVLRRNPNLVPALLGLSEALSAEIDNDAHIDHDRVVRRMDELSSRAVELNATHPYVWRNRTAVLSYVGQWEAALEASAKAVRLDPYDGFTLVVRAQALAYGGRPADALVLIEQAIAMDPPGNFFEMRVGCEAALLLGQYEQAIAYCVKAKGIFSSEDWWIDLFLAAAYAQQGDTAKAASEREVVLRSVPGYTIAALKSNGYSVNPDFIRLAEAHFYSGLRKAGFPEK